MDSKEPDTSKQSGTVKSTHGPVQFSLSTGQPLKTSATSQKSTGQQSKDQTSSLAASPAKISAKREGMWPTPTAREWKGGRKPESLAAAGRTSSNTLDDAIKATGAVGSLTPEFCEWLMGFPIGYTALNASEMPSSLKWRSLSEKLSHDSKKKEKEQKWMKKQEMKLGRAISILFEETPERI